MRDFVRKNLIGDGLELGPLHNSFPYEPKTTRIRYVDLHDTETLKRQYANDKNVDCAAIPNIDIVTHADKLGMIADKSVDFVCNSHLLEHLVNPIGAIEEWLRVIRPSGTLYMIVPDKEHCFDRLRPLTTARHIITDYEGMIDKIELNHYIEYWDKVRNIKDKAHVFASWKAQTPIHVHTWNYDTFESMINFLEYVLPMKVVSTKGGGDLNMCAVIKKTA